VKLPAYPRYKPSGVDWLGDVPEHWEVKRIKWSVVGCFNGVWGEEPNGGDDVTCVRVADFDRDNFLVTDKPPTLRAIESNQLKTRQLKKGDLLIEKSGGGEKQLVGCVVSFDHDFKAVCSNFVARMPVVWGLPPRYWCYVHAALYAGKLNYPAIKQTTGIQNLDSSAYLDTPAPFPKPSEQHTIATFLDRETGRIDRLVSKKLELIERLNEKRTALISRTVTRGLRNQNIQLVRLRRLIDGIDTGFTPDSYNFPAQADQEGVLKSGCVNGGVFDPNENKLLADDVEPPAKLEVKIGDILMSRASGSSDLIGSVAQVREQPAAKLYLSDKTFRLRVNKANCDEEFLVVVMGSNYLRSQLSQIISGAQGLAKNIAQSDMLELLLPSPPLDEQHAIATYLDRETSKIDRMVAKVEQAIDRLQEYRTALITAAVTGKIDVRKESHGK
jgi:type I restriction enzyme S subunit